MNSGEPGGNAGSRYKSYPVTSFPESERNALIDRIEQFPSITLSSESWRLIVSLASGRSGLRASLPGEDAFDSKTATLQSGGMDNSDLSPAILADEEELEDLALQTDAILRDIDGKNLALIHLTEKFKLETINLPAEQGMLAIAGAIQIIRADSVSNDQESLSAEAARGGKFDE